MGSFPDGFGKRSIWCVKLPGKWAFHRFLSWTYWVWCCPSGSGAPNGSEPKADGITAAGLRLILKRLIWRTWEGTAVSSRTSQQQDAEFSVLGFLPSPVTVPSPTQPYCNSYYCNCFAASYFFPQLWTPAALLPCTKKFKQTAAGPALTAPLGLPPAPFNTGYFKQRRSAEVNNAQSWLTFPQEINK